MEEKRSAFLYQFLDITSLNDTDHPEQIGKWTKEWVQLWERSEGLLTPAAICVFAPLVPYVIRHLGGMKIPVAAVTGNFPTGKAPQFLKVAETQYALEQGASEIDLVIDRGYAASGQWHAITEEVARVKAAAGNAALKVILETGQFSDPEIIRQMAKAALEGGADFLKTSTGKISAGASLQAAEILTQAVLEKGNASALGIKISGGVREPQQAEAYLALVENMRGMTLTTQNFRIGASGLAGTLASDFFGVSSEASKTGY